MAGNETLATLNGNPYVRARLAEIPVNTSQHIGEVISPTLEVVSENFKYTPGAVNDLSLDSLRGLGALAKVILEDSVAPINASIDESMQKIQYEYREIENARAGGVEEATFTARKVVRLRQDQFDIREYRRVTLLTTAANYAAAHKAAAVSFAASVVYNTLDNARNTIVDDFGKAPNVLALGSTAARTLKQNATIKAVYQGNGSGNGSPLSNEQLADFFEVEKVIVSRYQRKVNGTNTRFFPVDSALLGYIDQNPQTLDDQTLSATPTMFYDGIEVDVRVDGPRGVEKLMEAAAALRYRPLGLNYLAGYLWTGITAV